MLFIPALFLLTGFTCPVMNPSSLDAFSAFDNYSPELKTCLEKTARLCEQTLKDPSTENFKQITAHAFNQLKEQSEFLEFYCQNFEKGQLSYKPDRRCHPVDLKKELTEIHSCDFIPKKNEEASEARNICDQYLTDELKKPKYLTKDRKDNFKATLSKVIDGYKQLYPSNPSILKILTQISPDTDFEYRLSTFVAGAREKNDMMNCDPTWGTAEWCKGDYYIVPGGRIFSEPQNLELIIAHEVGHIINKVELPEKEYQKISSQLKTCNHLGSQNLDEDQLRSETSADIHMSQYHKNFMKDSRIETHFCLYEQPQNYLKANYLHPYHRQALLNCWSEFKN